VAPEQARGHSNLGPQSDQFYLGIVLFELAAGKWPFQRKTAAETTTAAGIAPAVRPRRKRNALWIASAALTGFLVAALWPLPPAGAPKITPFASEKEWRQAWNQGDFPVVTVDVAGDIRLNRQEIGRRLAEAARAAAYREAASPR
jgi:serine/threonine protein kinase